MLCEYGCNQEALFQFKNGKWCCSKNQSQCPVAKQKKTDTLKEQYKNGVRTSAFIELNKNHPRHEAGVWKHSNESLAKIGRKGAKMSEEFKQHRRIEMLERYANGWEVQCGRAKKYDYISPISGTIKVDGKWELKVAMYLDSIGVKWHRNKKRFDYFNSIDNKQATYCPDFYVEEWNTFIEVKGYKTELDEIKWQQFVEPLQVWDRAKLKELNIL